MAEQGSEPDLSGAEMDYAEHEKTYNIFLMGTKYGIIILASLLISMAFSFFTTAGFLSGTILFVLLVAVFSFLAR